jgi:two-component system, LytTR family, sensor histidine kinase AgrC
MITQAFLLLASGLQILAYAVFMNFMMEPRFSKKLNFCLTAAGYLLVAILSRLLEAYTIPKLLAANGLVILLIFVLFRSSVWYKLFTLLYTWVTVFALDMGAMILCVQWLHLSEYDILNNPAIRLGVTYFNYVFVLVLWLIPVMNKLHRTVQLQKQTVKRFVFYPLGHLLLIVGFYLLVEQYPSPQLAIYFALACLYCIVVNILLLKTMMDTAKKAELERKVQVMEYAKDLQLMEYDVLQEKERAVARLAHDYKNQLAVGLTLLEQKEYDRLAEQLRGLSNSLTTTKEVHFCRNRVVNAVLANKAALCRREDIDLRAELDVPEDTTLSDGELCSVFANLLDNAIKGVLPLLPEKRHITVKAGLDGCNLVVKTENPYDPTRYRKGKGLGQGIVRDIASSHDGDFLAMPQGENFVCLLSLQYK